MCRGVGFSLLCIAVVVANELSVAYHLVAMRFVPSANRKKSVTSLILLQNCDSMNT